MDQLCNTPSTKKNTKREDLEDQIRWMVFRGWNSMDGSMDGVPWMVL